MLKKTWYLIPLLFLSVTCLGQESKELGKEEPRAVLVPGSGIYSRKISTQNSYSQVFFDQGLRLAWGFYFPESIASYQE